jgi:hypothetical protein
MTLEEAKMLLTDSVRCELRDHAFGDREVSWYRQDGKMIADGYFGGGKSCVSFIVPRDENSDDGWETLADFEGEEAQELAKCGTVGQVERNDSTGPPTYSDGACMPGLTLKGVRDELTRGS